MPVPEIEIAGRLQAIYAASRETRQTLTTLHQVDSEGKESNLTLEHKVWNVAEGWPGVMLYVIPHPLGKKELWMAAFYVEPGSHYTGSSLVERRIVTVIEGSISCNGVHYGPGESRVISPGENTTWTALQGASGVTLYEFIDKAEPDI